MEDADDLAPYLDLTDSEVADLILMVLIEEKAKEKLARFRPKDLSSQPVQGLGELGVARNHVGLVGDALGRVGEEI